MFFVPISICMIAQSEINYYYYYIILETKEICRLYCCEVEMSVITMHDANQPSQMEC